MFASPRCLLPLLLLAQTSFVTQAQQIRTVKADVAQVTGPHSAVPLRVVGAGRAEEGLRADWQTQLATLQQQVGFKYLRMHGLLCDEMGVYDEDKQGNPRFNFQYVDALYDAMLKLHIRPFVEFAFMPSKLASGSSTIFWWKGNTSPPKDYAKWAMLIRALMDHWKARYGVQEIAQWYFEVWNEPDLKGFWPASLDEYFKLYQTTAEAVKQECPECRVGGPASASPYRAEQEFEQYVVAHHVPVDFVSSHSYGVKQGFLDADGTAGTILDADPDSVSGRMRHSRELLNATPLANRELHFTEWSSAYTPTDFMHDQYHEASFILDKIHRAAPYVDSMSYWTFTDIFEENGPRFTPFHGGFGMINLEGIKKPAFYAYRFLSQLGPQDVASNDPQSWVTRSPDGSIQALVWDYTPEVPPAGQVDQTFYKQERPAQPKGTLALKLLHVPNGVYLADWYQTGYRQNDAYTAYLRMGAPDQLTPQQVSDLNAQSSGAPIRHTRITVRDGQLDQSLPLRTNDVFLLTLKPVVR